MTFSYLRYGKAQAARLQRRLLIQVLFQCFARLTQRFLRRRNIAQSVQQAEIMDLTKINQLSTINSQLRTIFSLSSPMATLQNCEGVLNDLSRNADRPAVFTLRKRGSETWSYADLDGCVDRSRAADHDPGFLAPNTQGVPGLQAFSLAIAISNSFAV